MTQTIRDALTDLEKGLLSISKTYKIDAQVLLAHALHRPRTWILAHPEIEVNSDQSQRINEMHDRFLHGMPLPYILGYWEFYGLDFKVTPDVLIPRPETETLVDHAINYLTPIIKLYNSEGIVGDKSLELLIADIGTGSGCIAVTLAVHFPTVHIIAIDKSIQALHVARYNAKIHNVSERIFFLQADLLTPLLTNSFNLICANLPYIPSKILHQLPVYGKEPSLALDGGEDGLDQIGQLLIMAPGFLLKDGLLLCEIEANQGEDVIDKARNSFPDARISIYPDLAGRDRLLVVGN